VLVIRGFVEPALTGNPAKLWGAGKAQPRLCPCAGGLGASRCVVFGPPTRKRGDGFSRWDPKAHPAPSASQLRSFDISAPRGAPSGRKSNKRPFFLTAGVRRNARRGRDAVRVCTAGARGTPNPHKRPVAAAVCIALGRSIFRHRSEPRDLGSDECPHPVAGPRRVPTKEAGG